MMSLGYIRGFRSFSFEGKWDIKHLHVYHVYCPSFCPVNASYRKTHMYAVAWVTQMFNKLYPRNRRSVYVCMLGEGGVKNEMCHDIVCQSLYINVMTVKKPTLLAYFSNDLYLV